MGPVESRQTSGKPDISLLAGRTILVVEDEFLICLDLCETLETYGGDILMATSLEEGFTKSILPEGRIDAVLLDVNLGGLTVFPLANMLQEQGVPLVFHSGHAELLPDLPRRYPGALWLSKPSEMSAIAAALATQIGAGED
jgi:DNA-binding response OmpR family regulator